MIACMRTRALPLARLPRSSLAHPLPRSWVAGFSSGADKNSSSNDSNSEEGGAGSGTSASSSSDSLDGSAADVPAASPPESGAGAGFDPAAVVAQAPPPSAADAASGAEPWSSAAAHQFLTDFPSSLTPLMADAGMSLLWGAISVGGQVTGGIQSGVEGLHRLTGLPWWATIAVATIGVKVSLFPVVVYQAGHMDRVRMAWPEIQVLRGHLASTLEEVRDALVLFALFARLSVTASMRQLALMLS